MALREWRLWVHPMLIPSPALLFLVSLFFPDCSCLVVSRLPNPAKELVNDHIQQERHLE